MSKIYLYAFGYESLEDHLSNQSAGTDYESTGCFWLESDSEAEAIAWGNKLAEYYIRHLYMASEWQDVNWQEGKFCSWIEESPGEELAETASKIGSIKVGSYPRFNDVRKAFCD